MEFRNFVLMMLQRRPGAAVTAEEEDEFIMHCCGRT